MAQATEEFQIYDIRIRIISVEASLSTMGRSSKDLVQGLILLAVVGD